MSVYKYKCKIVSFTTSVSESSERLMYAPKLNFRQNFDYIIDKALCVFGVIRRHSGEINSENRLAALYNVLCFGTRDGRFGFDVRRIHLVRSRFLNLVGFTRGNPKVLQHKAHKLAHNAKRRNKLGRYFIGILFSGRFLEKLYIRVSR